MRHILKNFIISTASLYIVSQAVDGLVFAEGNYTLLLAGFAIMLSSFTIKPVINILLLPLNLVTLGLFRWVAYAITFYLVTLVVPGFKLVEFAFKGFQSYWLSLPAFTFHGILAFVAFSFAIAFVSSFLHWIFK